MSEQTKIGVTYEQLKQDAYKLARVERDLNEALDALEQILQMAGKVDPLVSDSWTLCRIAEVASETYLKHRKPRA
jgi:hypothetical protein